MLRSQLFLLGCASALAVVGFVGCGDDDPATDDDDGTSSNVGLPPAPGPEKPGDGGVVVMGVSSLYLGDRSPSGQIDSNAWKNFGYNLDGQVTENDFANHCQPVGNVPPKEIFSDGNDGLDNSFGQNIMPIILGFASDAGDQINAGIADGSFTVIVEMDGLGADADYNPLPSRLNVGTDGMGGSWMLVPELLSNPSDPTSSKIQFPSAYLVENTFVSGAETDLNLNLEVGGFALNLPISNAIVSMNLDAGHTNATGGIIAGVLDTEGLISELQKIAGSVSTELCSGSTFDSIANQLRQASDIMADGSQDPNATCNGISIGLGFDMTTVTIGGVGEPSMGGSDPCDTSAGTGTDTGTGTGTGMN